MLCLIAASDKMKNYILYLVTAYLMQRIQAKISFEDSSLQTFIESRCRNATDEALALNIKTRLKNFDGYLNDIEDIKEIFCSDTIFKLNPMMKQLTLDMKPCFPDKNESYIPNFIFEGFSQFLEFICGNRTLEILYSDQGIDCSIALSEYMNGEVIKNCSYHIVNIFNLEIVTFDDMCYGLDVAEKCYSDAIKHGCPYFVAFQLLNEKFFRSVGKLCNRATISYISNLILIISVFLSFWNYIIII